MDIAVTSGPPVQSFGKWLNLFERYLTIWVALCMVTGLLLGRSAPNVIQWLRSWEFGEGSHVNASIALLIWIMIIPMMMKIDLASIRNVGNRPRGLLVTIFVNWIIKPFSMAFFAWVFFRLVFSAWIAQSEADQYIAGTIILAAAPCTAMVFVWSYLTDGDPAYTLVQVSVNDLRMLVLFAPIVGFLVTGASALTVPLPVLFYSVLTFFVIPLIIGVALRHWFIAQQGQAWFEDRLLPRFAPITTVALLAMLVFFFAFQADNITGKTWHVVLIAVPILIQVYFNASLAYVLMKCLNVPHSVAGTGSTDRREQFLRVGGCYRDRLVWT